MSDIYQRKRDHLDLCHTGEVTGATHGGLLDEVYLVHDALPELALSEIDLRAELLDRPLDAPVMVTGMTGGPAEAGEINRALAVICQALGIAFGVGSQRIITKDAAALDSFQVRGAAPDVVLLANLGVMQAKAMGVASVKTLMERIEADALAIHLNPAMELVQPGRDADRDFRGGLETIARLVDALDGRVVVKECGTGLSRGVVQRLAACGVRAVDVSGAGGTSWVKVEALRAQVSQPRSHRLGLLFADWGVPTAAAVLGAAGVGPQVIASGGIGDGRAAAHALALGADLVGAARPVLQALLDSGPESAHELLETMIDAIRLALALTGCRRPTELRLAPRVLGPRLSAWEAQLLAAWPATLPTSPPAEPPK